MIYPPGTELILDNSLHIRVTHQIADILSFTVLSKSPYGPYSWVEIGTKEYSCSMSFGHIFEVVSHIDSDGNLLLEFEGASYESKSL